EGGRALRESFGSIGAEHSDLHYPAILAYIVGDAWQPAARRDPELPERCRPLALRSRHRGRSRRGRAGGPGRDGGARILVAGALVLRDPRGPQAGGAGRDRRHRRALLLRAEQAVALPAKVARGGPPA